MKFLAWENTTYVELQRLQRQRGTRAACQSRRRAAIKVGLMGRSIPRAITKTKCRDPLQRSDTRLLRCRGNDKMMRGRAFEVITVVWQCWNRLVKLPDPIMARKFLTNFNPVETVKNDSDLKCFAPPPPCGDYWQWLQLEFTDFLLKQRAGIVAPGLLSPEQLIPLSLSCCCSLQGNTES